MISLALTEDQRLAQNAVAQFAAAEARPAARSAEEAAAFPDSLLASAWRLGLIQAIAGGDKPDQPTVVNALALEELAYGDAALAVALAAPLGFVKAVSESGTAAQRSVYLPQFAGDTPRLAAIAHVDAGWFGGRPTRAHRVGARWRLDGAKALAPLAARCERFLVTAQTDEDVAAFVVEADAPGVEIAEARGTLGLRALRMADVAFHGVAVNESERLPSGVRRLVDLSRVALSAILCGLSRAVYDYVLPYTKQRVVHGEALARKQAVAFKLADMHIETQAMRWMGLRAASELDAAPTATRLARLAQRYAGERGLSVADEGVQLFGGYGFVRDLPLEMWYRNARTLSVLDGLIGV